MTEKKPSTLSRSGSPNSGASHTPNWVARIDAEPFTEEITRGDKRYHLELVCAWDSQPWGNVRVMASVDDGGFRAFIPLGRDFIKRSDECFVGE